MDMFGEYILAKFMFSRAYNLRLNDSSEEILGLLLRITLKMPFLCRMDVWDFEILLDVTKGPMHESCQRVSSVVRVDVRGPYVHGVICKQINLNLYILQAIYYQIVSKILKLSGTKYSHFCPQWK